MDGLLVVAASPHLGIFEYRSVSFSDAPSRNDHLHRSALYILLFDWEISPVGALEISDVGDKSVEPVS